MEWNTCEQGVQGLLRRNGIICERARRAGRSLTKLERSIIIAGREKAMSEGLERIAINAHEMDGEREFTVVLAPIKVKAVFGFWEESGMVFGDAPEPAWLVRQSNHPSLTPGSHVGVENFERAGLKVPKAMPYEKWVKKGRKVVRS